MNYHSTTLFLTNILTARFLSLVFLLTILLLPYPGRAQETDTARVARIYTLQQIVDLALERSPFALQAQTERETRYWEWRTFRADYMPSLFLQGFLPDFTRSNEAVQQPDGSYEFRPVSQNLTNLNLYAQQAIGLTNTTLFINSQLQRFDNFENGVTTYSGNPAVIGLQQPLFQFNELKWNRAIAPLAYEESKREYVERREDIAIWATQNFFDVLLAQINLAVARTNLANNDTIYQISQGRYNLGKIAENELLKLELNLMNSRQAVAQAQLDLETNTLELKSFIGLIGSEPITLLLPAELPGFAVDEGVAIQQALQHRADAVGFDRRLKEAEMEVARARSEGQLNMDLFATYGLTDRADELTGVYQRPENQQRLRLGLTIPILDWGRNKSLRKTAEAYLKLEQYTIQQERITFQQEVYTQVKTYEMLRNQVKITQVATDIADRSYEIARQRYLIGKISVNDLSIAFQEKEQARQQYIETLRQFWNDYYELRKLTLYDFETSHSLYRPEEVSFE